MIEQFFYALFNPAIPLLRYAAAAGLISSIAFGMAGTYVVIKRTTYIAGAVSHTALAGIGVSLFLKEIYGIAWFTPIFGGIISSVIAALIISWITIKGKERADTAIGITWAAGMAIGILLIFKTPGYGDPTSYLFGNILLVSKTDLYFITALDIIIIFFIIAFYRQFLAISFDEEFARVKGLNTVFYEIILNIIIAITVVLMVSTVGVVMVIAFLTIPPASASLFVKKLWKIMLFSVILCAFITLAGLFLSFVINMPSGPVTIISASIIYIIFTGIKKIMDLKTGKTRLQKSK